MNSVRTLGIVLVTVLATGIWSPAAAQFDFVGDAIPADGSQINTTIGETVRFEVSVFDDGRTNQSTTDRAPGIGLLLRWRAAGSTDPYTEIEMAFNRKDGPFGPNNDVFRLDVEYAVFAGIDMVEWTAFAVDSTAGDLLQEASQDKNGQAPPFTFSFSNVPLTDVDVTFLLCTNGIDSMLTKFDSGFPIPIDYEQSICVAGSAPELDNFGGNAPVLIQDGTNPDLYRVTVTFPAGGAETISYKYRVNGCDLFELEGFGNDRTFTIDYTVPEVVLPLALLDDTDTDPLDSTCAGTPVEPSTWGSLKTRYGGGE